MLAEWRLGKMEDHAYRLLQSDPEWEADARAGVPVGNTVVGSVMSMTFGAPRQVTEHAVACALQRIDAERIDDDR